MPEILRFLSIPAKYLAADRYSRRMHKQVIELNKQLASKLKKQEFLERDKKQVQYMKEQIDEVKTKLETTLKNLVEKINNAEG